MTNVKSGNIEILAGDLPSFLYEEDGEFDLERQEIGLLKGCVPMRV